MITLDAWTAAALKTAVEIDDPDQVARHLAPRPGQEDRAAAARARADLQRDREHAAVLLAELIEAGNEVAVRLAAQLFVMAPKPAPVAPPVPVVRERWWRRFAGVSLLLATAASVVVLAAVQLVAP